MHEKTSLTKTKDEQISKIIKIKAVCLTARFQSYTEFLSFCPSFLSMRRTNCSQLDHSQHHSPNLFSLLHTPASQHSALHPEWMGGIASFSRPQKTAIAQMQESGRVVAGITGRVKLTTGLPELEYGFPWGKADEAVNNSQVVVNECGDQRERSG